MTGVTREGRAAGLFGFKICCPDKSMPLKKGFATNFFLRFAEPVPKGVGTFKQVRSFRPSDDRR